MVKLVDAQEMYQTIDDLLGRETQRDPYKRFTILSYQIGALGKTMRYSFLQPDKKDAYRLYMKTELSDLLTQTMVMSRLFGYDINELLEMGKERLQEYMHDFAD
jgi:hypothetical protein